MKSSKDKSIQEQLDKQLKDADFNQTQSHNEDEKIYRILYQDLKRDPQYQLPVDFADKVITKTQLTGFSTFLLPDHRPLLIVIPVMLLLISGIFWGFKLKLNLETLSMSSNMVITLVFGILGVILIQIADQKLLKSKIFKALK